MERKSWALFLILTMLFAKGAFSQGPPSRKVNLTEFTLEKPGGKKVPLSQWEGSPVAFLTFATTCPICQQYTLPLKELQAEFPEFEFVLVFPGNPSGKDLRRFRRKYKLKFALLRDPENSFSRELLASVTPQAFLLNANGIVEYSGRIDDRFPELGKRRPEPTRRDLAEALLALEENRNISVPHTTPIGCFIRFD